MELEEGRGIVVMKDAGKYLCEHNNGSLGTSTVGTSAMMALESKFRHAQRRPEGASWQRLSPPGVQ